MTSEKTERTDVILATQKKLALYMRLNDFMWWRKIKKSCNDLIDSLPIEEKEMFSDIKHLDFCIFVPLLRTGIVEVCRSQESSHLLFCINPELKNPITIPPEQFPFETTFSPLSFLQNYTSIKKQIEDYNTVELDIIALRFILNNLYTPEEFNSTNRDVGIYKTDKEVWKPSYLLDKEKNIKKIPFYMNDPDAMNIARLYVRIFKDETLFKYYKNSNKLQCLHYSEMPILICRALLLFKPEQITQKKYFMNSFKITFENVPIEAVSELKRIFSDCIKIIT